MILYCITGDCAGILTENLTATDVHTQMVCIGVLETQQT
jgi:hypothetical protein